ncbi:MAG TPA: hypothetical protein VN247_08520, partial [Arenimonas sp.]|nr:hypothetical protein [Arenimonas sp.]
MPVFNIPQSFIGRPYAEKHFSQIVKHAFTHNPFYRHFYAESANIPLLTREILQKHNDELLNGNPVTGKTSGSTSVPVRTHWSPARGEMDARDSQSYAEWFGGRLKHAKIIALSAHQAAPNTFEVASPVFEQLQFLRDQIAQGVRSLISYPTNLEQLSKHLLIYNEPVPELKRIICMSELFESSQEALIKRAFPNAEIGSTYSSTEV